MPFRDRELTIKIAAKNLTANEFKKAREELLGLDRATGKTKKGAKGLETSFSSLGNSLRQIHPQIGGVASGLSQMVGPLGAIAAAGAAVGVVSSITVEFQKLGATLVDMSAKTALPLSTLQELGFAGEQVGLNIDTVSDAVLRLGRRTAQELPETTKWLEKIGLDSQAIINMDPASAFRDVAEAIGRIQNPAQQSAAAMAIFGDRGLQILPLIRSDVDATIETFHRMGGVIDDEVLQAGKRLDDQMTNLRAAFQGIKAEVAGETIPVLSELASLLEKIAERRASISREGSFLGDLLGGASGGGVFAGQSLERAAGELSLLNTALEGIHETIRSTPKAPPEGILGGLTEFAAGPQGDAALELLTESIPKGFQSTGSVLDQELARIRRGFTETNTVIRMTAGELEHLSGLAPPVVQDFGHMRQVAGEMGSTFQEEINNPFSELSSWLDALPNDFDITTKSVESLTGESLSLSEATGKATMAIGQGANILSIFGVNVDSAVGKATRLTSNIVSLAESFKGLGGLKQLFGSGGALAGIGSALGKGLGAITGALGAAGPFGWIAAGGLGAGLLLKNLFGGPDIGRDVGRDLGVQISEELEKTIRESGQPIQLAVADIFREGFASGTATADMLAEEIGDLFSGFERGEYGKPQLIQALEESVPMLIERLQELGPAGEEQLQRIIGAAERFGVTFEGLSELVEGTFAPDTMEEIAKAFDITNDEVRELADKLGIDVQTNLERMASQLGLSVNEFKSLGEAVKEEFGIPMESIEDLLNSMGVTSKELADALGVEVSGGAAGLEGELSSSNKEMTFGANEAGRLADELERAARAAGGIHIPGSPGLPPVEGFQKETPEQGLLFSRPRTIRVGEVPEIVTVRHASRGREAAPVASRQSGGMVIQMTNDFRGAFILGDENELAERLAEKMRDSGRASEFIRDGQSRIGA